MSKWRHRHKNFTIEVKTYNLKYGWAYYRQDNLPPWQDLRRITTANLVFWFKPLDFKDRTTLLLYMSGK